MHLPFKVYQDFYTADCICTREPFYIVYIICNATFKDKKVRLQRWGLFDYQGGGIWIVGLACAGCTV